MDTVNTGVQNYVNTLIFCLVAKGVSIAVLILLLLEWGQKYAYALITVEMMLIIIIIVSIYRVASYEKRIIKKREEMLLSTDTVGSCPDFYTRNFENNMTTCKNSYTTPDGRYTYTLGTDALSSINLNYISNNNQRTLQEVCDIIGNTKADYNTSVSWTSLKPRCASL